jgi:F-type H+-transporting ATPase subunit b
MGNYFVPVALAASEHTEDVVAEGETELITGTESASHGEAETAHEGGLALEPSTIIFQAFNFLVLLVVLKLILYKPLLKIMKEREERIKDGIANAARADQMMEESEETRLQTIKAAKVQSHNILESARGSAEDTKANILEEAQKASDEIIENGHNIVELEKERASQELKEQSVNLIIQTAEKVLREKLDDIKDRKMIEENLKNYSL